MNELRALVELLLLVCQPIFAVLSGIALTRLLYEYFRVLFIKADWAANSSDGPPTIVEQLAMAELQKAKHEDSDDGGYSITDDEARSMGLAPDWREQIQMMREDESRE